MIQRAIEKIKTEKESNSNNPYIQTIGDFLLKQLEINKNAAEKIMIEGKTIAKSIDAMKSEAKKKAVNGMAMLTDEEGFGIVMKYFGMEAVQVEVEEAIVNVKIDNAKAEKDKDEIDFYISLDDLL